MSRAPATAPCGDIARVYVFLGPDWGRHPNSLAHLASVIGRTEPVIWINSIGQRSPRLTRRDFLRLWEKAKRAIAVVQRPKEALHGPQAVIEPRIVPLPAVPVIRRWNAQLLVRQLRGVLSQFADHEMVFLTSNPLAVDLVRVLNPRITAYYCMDEYAEMSDCDADLMIACEPLMVQAADVVFATSRRLCESKKRLGKEVHYLSQGVDYHHFTRAGRCPEVLEGLPRPILGFHGIIGQRVDLALFEKVLQRFPRVSLVAIGKQEADLARLRRYRNFHVFPAVPYEVLPVWSGQFDIGLIAYTEDGHTASVNPLKLLEYLAIGIPVVSSALPELARYADHVSIAKTHEEYLCLLEQVIKRYPFAQSERDKRREYARTQSWESRVQTVMSIFNVLMSTGRCDEDQEETSRLTSGVR